MPKTSARRSTALRRTLAPAFVTATALLAFAPGASAVGWVDGPAFAVPEEAVGIAVAEAPDGSATAAWAASSDGGATWVAVAQQADATGAVGPVHQLGDATEGTLTDVAVSAAGRTVIAWAGADEAGETPLRIAALTADGSPGPTRAAATTETDSFDAALDVAVDDAGTATLVWDGIDPDSGLHAAYAVRVSADGTAADPVVLGEGTDPTPQVAVTPAGTAWATWFGAGGSAWVARLDAGAQPAAEPLQASSGAVMMIGVDAGSAGGALAWIEQAPDGRTRAAGVRLPLVGAQLGDRFEAPADDEVGPLGGPAIAPDGTVSLAWNTLVGRGAALPLGAVWFARFAPGQSTAPAQLLAAPADGSTAILPLLGGAPDGSVVLSWFDVAPTLARVDVQGVRVAPDGAVSAVAKTPAALSFLAAGPFGTVQSADNVGGGMLALVGGPPVPPLPPSAPLTVHYLDAAPPVVSVAVPASATVAAAVPFAATISDRTPVQRTWDFGDESESRAAAPRHRYAEAGTYTVTLTARDAAGNETVVRRQLTITPPPAPPAPPAPRPAARAAAALKLTKASRVGARVTVAGTIARSASGRVTIVYAQRIGRRTIRATTTARIANARWSTTLRLPRALARAPRSGATVTVSYAGDADTLAASVKRAVTTPKAKKPKPKRR